MQNTCQPCTSKTPKLNPIEISKLLSEVPQYALEEVDGVHRIFKIYTFKNYNQALAFTNKIALLSEKENHHPQIILEWGKVRLTWWTHAIDGLDTNDFIMALKSEKLLHKN